ncbi:MAG: hypothetical protein ABDH28_05095 [Brevinematia bacterium]
MFIPISLLWIHVILVLFSFLLGRSLSKILEPIPIDNIIKEVHNKRTPIFFTTLLLLINLIGIALLRYDYLPSLKLTEVLVTKLEGTPIVRIVYLLIHSSSVLVIPTLIKFLTSYEYKYKVLISLLLVVVSLGVVHFLLFFVVFSITVLTM